MSTRDASGETEKYAWRRIAGQDLPKRSASERTGDFREAHYPYDAAMAQEQASRCVQCPHPGCVLKCPVGSPIQAWLELTAAGRFVEAAEVSRHATPIPDICARLCPKDHFCEDACVLNGPSEPVSIGAIEEFLEEYALTHGSGRAAAAANGWRVAVVGSGPAGLACADALSRRGYGVTLVDAEDTVGGALVHGTSAFRLDRSIVERRVGILRQRGVEFRLGVALGGDVSLAELRATFDAVFVGLDARQPRGLPVPGGDWSGVIAGASFIEGPFDREIAGRRVVVVGDDDTALDCVRTAIRRGAREVVAVCPHREAELPWCRREFDDAVEEGASFVFGVVPDAIVPSAEGDAAVLRLKLGAGLSKNEGEADGALGTGELSADRVVVAMGDDPVPALLPGDFAQLLSEGAARVTVDTLQMTGLPGVFAGGDVVRGPCLAVHAIQDARQAVDGIAAYLAERAAERGAEGG